MVSLLAATLPHPPARSRVAVMRPGPEAPVNPQERLVDAQRRFLIEQRTQSVRFQVLGSPSELIDRLVHTTDPTAREELVELIALSGRR